MNTVLIYEIDDIKQINQYLNDIEENAIFTPQKDKLTSFLEINNIPYTKKKLGSIQKNTVRNNSKKIITDKKNMVICFSKKDEVIAMAKYYARKKDSDCYILERNDMDSFIEQRNRGFEYCCIITEEDNVPFVQRLIIKNNTFSVGIIAGRDEWETLYIINKNITASGRTIRNVVSVDRTDFTTQLKQKSKGFTYIPYNDSTKETLCNAINNCADVFSFMGHGRDEHLWLNKGLICNGPDGNECGEILPYCKKYGRCFEKNFQVLPISETYVINVFINACLTGKIRNGSYGSQYNVAQAFLGEYASSYIGTPFLARAIEAIPHYYTALAMAGYMFGDICYYLNILLQNYKIGLMNNYVLFGDPLFFLKADDMIYRLDLEDERKNIDFNLEKNKALIIIRFKWNLFDDFYALNREVSIKSKSQKPIYCSMIWNNDFQMTVLHVFTRGFLDEGAYSLRISDIKLKQKWDIDGLYSVNDIIHMGLTNAKINRFWTESIGALDNFKQSLDINLTRLDNIGKTVYSKYQKLQNRVRIIHEDIVLFEQNHIHNSGELFEDFYMDVGFIEESRKAIRKKCCYCNGDLYEHDVQSKIYKVKRMHHFCLKCGNILTAPHNSLLNLWFYSNDVLKKNKKNSIIMNIKNISNELIVGVAAVAVENGRKYGFTYAPEMVQFELDTNEEQEIEFVIDCTCDDINPLRRLAGIVMANNQFYTITKPIYFLK